MTCSPAYVPAPDMSNAVVRRPPLLTASAIKEIPLFSYCIARLRRERDVKNACLSFREPGQHVNKCPEPNRKIWLRIT